MIGSCVSDPCQRTSARAARRTVCPQGRLGVGRGGLSAAGSDKGPRVRPPATTSSFRIAAMSAGKRSGVQAQLGTPSVLSWAADGVERGRTLVAQGRNRADELNSAFTSSVRPLQEIPLDSTFTGPRSGRESSPAPADDGLAIAHRAVDVGAASELRPEQKVHRSSSFSVMSTTEVSNTTSFVLTAGSEAMTAPKMLE